MLIIQIDRFDAQPAKARVASTEDIPWRAVHASDAVRIEAEAKLSCDDDTLARDLAQETPDQFLVFVRAVDRSEEHTSELQSRGHLVCRLLLEKKKKKKNITY